MAASGFFTFKATSPYGGAYINYLQSNLNVVHDFREACYFLVQLDGRVYLATDTGAQWQDNGYVGTARTIGNSQCSINLATSTVAINGNDMVARLKITYPPIFAGTKRFFMAAADNGGIATTGYWVNTNTDYVPNPAPAMLLTANKPTASPNSGNAFTYTFQIKNTNPFGRDFISGALMLINANLDGGTACWISYSRVDNGFYMLNSGQYGKPGDSDPLVSPQCTLHLSTTYVTQPDSQTIVISAYIRFPDPRNSDFQFPGVLGTTNSWILAKDRAGRDFGWEQSASPITVNIASPSAPTYDSPPDSPAYWNGPANSVVIPNLTKGVYYTFNVNEPNTGNYMNWSQVYMGPEGANTKGLCYFLYSNLDDRIYLAYANSAFWRDSASRTDGRVLDNGICRIRTGAATTSVVRNGVPGKLSVSLTIEFYNSHLNTEPLNSAPGENPSIWNTMIGYMGNHAIRFYSQNRAGVGNAIPWSALDANNVCPSSLVSIRSSLLEMLRPHIV